MNEWAVQFEHPIWLAGLVVLLPVVWLGLSSLSGLGPWRQRLAIALRVLVLGLLIVLLAGPLYARKFRHLSVMAVVDRSQSVPAGLQQAAMKYLNTVVKDKPGEDRIGVVWAGEIALIHSLPNTTFTELAGLPPAFSGDRTDLEAGVRMALAVLPGDTANRILLISDGNENVGDLRGAAKIARANHIALDVLALNYDHEHEVMFERLIVPPNARTGQTIAAKCVLRSTGPATGKLLLEDNGVVLKLDPKSGQMALPVTLKPGLNVTTLLLPIQTGGTHRFQASFTPDNASMDTITANNNGAGVTFVFGRGRVLVADSDGKSSQEILRVLREARMDAVYKSAAEFPTELVDLMEYDGVVLVNTPNSAFSLDQQEMMTRYVHDMGGGLVMVGGPDGFGAGGWIGSPVEEALPVILDPPQKQQMPKGALVLIMHSVEMPQGNYWGEVVAISAVRTLSRLDLVGVLDYDFSQGGTTWVFPLAPAGDKEKVVAAIKAMQMGDMPDFNTSLVQAYSALTKCDAGQRHIIIISDGDPSPPMPEVISKIKTAKITVTGVIVYPHSPADYNTLDYLARQTGGRFYNVTDPNKLPQIFIKETQMVRRPLILEQPFTPKIIDPLSEMTKGIELSPPKLDGYVLTAEKKELVENIMVSPQGDPILASRQYGLGKTVAFTSDASSRWAKGWLTWSRFGPFWEQVVRWSMRSGESPNFQVSTDVEGQRAVVVVEAMTSEAGFSNFLDFRGTVVDPALKTQDIQLQEIGPGRYQASFPIDRPGNYVLNLQYRDGQKTGMVRGAVALPFAPEFHDLKNNAPLLAEAAEISGGRVLTGNPKTDKTFDHAALVFPFEKKPLWKELSILWLVLFLLDVAVRRVVIDIAAIREWMRKMAARLRKTEFQQGTVDTLQKRKLEVQKKMKGMGTAVAQARFEAPAESVRPVEPLAAQPPAPKKAEEKPEKPGDKAAPESSYLERLKQAKQKAKDNMKKEDAS